MIYILLICVWSLSMAPGLQLPKPKRLGFSEVRFAGMTLAHKNIWFGKRKNERVEDEKL